MDELDPIERRRIQNRNAQRKYRHRRNQHRVARAQAGDGLLRTVDADERQNVVSGRGSSAMVDPPQGATNSSFARRTVEQHQPPAATYNNTYDALNTPLSSVPGPAGSTTGSYNDTQGVAGPLPASDLLDGIRSSMTDPDRTPASHHQFYPFAPEPDVCAASDAASMMDWDQQSGYVAPRDYVSMLHIASIRGQTRTVLALLEYRLPIDAWDTSGRTPLHLATMNRHTDVVRLLLSRGAHVDLADAEGRSALHWAVIQKHEELLHILLQRGADVNQCEQNGRSPLQMCVERGWEEGFRVLMGRGADPSLRSKEREGSSRGETPDN